MTMLQLAGPPAATAFRLKKLRAELRALAPVVTDVTVYFEHYVSLAEELRSEQERVLRALLDYGDGAVTPQNARQRIYVVPRLGTISPWASKATDIARLCSLPVRRVERGRVYELTVTAVLTAADIKRAASLLHDRMTETLLTEPPTRAALFADHEPRPARAGHCPPGGRR